jgi:transcriptional regulator of heat shock response
MSTRPDGPIIGVIGPTRVRYSRVIAVVDAAAGGLAMLRDPN